MTPIASREDVVACCSFCLRSHSEVEKLVAEHSQARKARDFARSDAIRAQLLENGVILENTKDGVRWKRK